MFLRALFVGCVALGSVCAEAAMRFKALPEGMEFEGSAGGAFVLPYPVLETTGGKWLGAEKVVPDGARAEMSYPGGTQLEVFPNLEGGGLQFHFTSVAGDIKQLQLKMELPESVRSLLFADGDAAPKAFPAAAPENGFLASGNGKRIAFVNKDKKGFVLGAPFGWVELRDARIWGNNPAVIWMTSTAIPRSGDESWYLLTLLDPTAPKPAPSAAQPAPPPASKKAFDTRLTGEGIQVSLGEGGDYTISYPGFQQENMKKPQVKVESAQRAVLSYPGGAKAVASLNGVDFKMAFEGLPGGELRTRTDVYIPINFSQGGKYKFDGKEGSFPAEKAERGKVFQGDGGSFSLVHPTGLGFTISGVDSFQELQDNREWNWPIFMWMLHKSIFADNGRAELNWKITQEGSGKVAVLVDRYGQFTKADFPTKIKSDEDLKKDFAADKQYYASLKPPQRDPYGGLLGSKAKYGLKATGFFHLEKIKGTDVLVTPEGNAFFQLGMCGIMPLDEYTDVHGRESIYEEIPKNDPKFASAFRDGHKVFPSFHLINYIRKTGQPYEPKSYLNTWIDRLRAWGFNSGGAWAFQGNMAEVRDARKFPYVEFLPFPGLTRVPHVNGIWDPFAPGVEQKLDEAFAKNLTPRAKDPLIIGFFINNEPHTENVPKVVPTLKGDSPAKCKLVELLQAKYKNIAAFNKAWGTTYAGFDALKDAELQARTREAGEDTESFYRLFLREYYRLINTAFRKYAPNHLLIGDRLMPGTASSQTLIEESSRVLDILSVNYYSYAIDKEFLTRLHKWSGGKPMIFSEFYYTSGEQGLSGGMKVATDRDRGLAYRNYLEQAAALKFVVGIQWFIAVDQPPTGRFFQGYNGEAANTGLINVGDRPYKAMLEEMMKANYGIYDVLLGGKAAYVYNDPRFTGKKGGARKTVAAPRLTKPFKLDAARTEWPGIPAEILSKDGLVYGLNADGFEATFHVAWDDENLYLFADVQDPTPLQNKQKGADIWNGDAIELFIGSDLLDQGGSLKYCDRQVMLRAAPPFDADAAFVANGPALKKPIRLLAVPMSNGKGYSLEAAIPFEDLGFKPKTDMLLLFDLAINDSSTGEMRQRQSVWNGSAGNSKNRTLWGYLKLVP